MVVVVVVAQRLARYSVELSLYVFGAAGAAHRVDCAAPPAHHVSLPSVVQLLLLIMCSSRAQWLWVVAVCLAQTQM